MERTPKSMRLQIGLFGRTNVGKSSFLNYVAGQDVAVTSPVPGTTTDVVEKAMELLPLGPVLFLDTGGLDDTSVLAERRMQRTERAFSRADVAILVTEPNVWGQHEERVCHQAREHKIPLVIVVNKMDLGSLSDPAMILLSMKSEHVLTCSCADPDDRERCVTAFKEALLEIAPEHFLTPASILGDLMPPGGLAVLIVPIDKEAPKGRLILPEVQAIRDALDHGQAAVVVRETEYARILQRLGRPPDLVVCDSQVVDRMVADTPPGVPCTTFSILFSRFKGDLVEQARGTAAITVLHPGSRVLIAEACTHHAVADDIGRVKIPNWLRRHVGGDVQVDVCSGRDYPPDLADYEAVIHCGACMLTRREMLVRIRRAREQGVPVTNYGLCISFLQGVLPRVLEPFPQALRAFEDECRRRRKVSDDCVVEA